jgi:quinol monooxygenase YgiN
MLTGNMQPAQGMNQSGEYHSPAGARLDPGRLWRPLSQILDVKPIRSGLRHRHYGDGRDRRAQLNPRPAMTTLLNVLTVDPANQAQLLELLRANTDAVIRTLDGWISTDLIASADGTRVVIHSQWRDVASVDAMRRDSRMVAYFPRIAALAAFDSMVGDVAHSFRGDASVVRGNEAPAPTGGRH